MDHIVAGRAAVVGVSVQVNIGQLQTGTKLRVGRAGRKDQPVHGHTMSQGVGLETLGRGFVVVHQPKQSIRDALQQPHPCGKHFRCDFVGVAKRPHHKSPFRQPQLRTGHYRCVVCIRHHGQIAAFYIQRLFGEINRQLIGQHMPVGNHKIKPGHPCGPHEAQVSALSGGRMQGKNTRPRAGTQTVQVNQDIDFIGQHQLSGLPVRQILDGSEMVKLSFQMFAQRCALFGAVVVGKQFVSFAMAIHQRRQQKAYRVLTEVARHIAHSQARVLVCPALGQAFLTERIGPGDKRLRVEQLLGRVLGQSQHGQR